MPMVVSDQERVRRVTEESSRRKRDLAAVRRVEAQEQRGRLERIQGDAAAISAATELVDRLAAAVPESTFKIWLEPLRAVGAQGTTLYLAAPDGIRTWVERRYASLIREALQGTGSGYTDVEFVDMGEGSACQQTG